MRVMYSSVSIALVHVLSACAQMQSALCDVLFIPQLVTILRPIFVLHLCCCIFVRVLVLLVVVVVVVT